MATDQLIGTVRADRPLLVVAVAEEAQFLPAGLPVLITGAGKINASMNLTAVLAGAVRPASVVNLGTAGALRPGRPGIHLIRTVIQHDLDSPLLKEVTGQPFGEPLTLPEPGGASLATGDVFVTGGTRRDELAEKAELVDMEGYAVAAVAQRFGVPVRLVKLVSDEADEHAVRTWRETVSECARVLAKWVENELV